MKQNFISFLVLLAISCQYSFSQSTNSTVIDSKEYEQMKQENKIPPGLQIFNSKSFSPTLDDFKRLGGGGGVHTLSSSGCSCYIAPDNTYTLAMAPNDDGSTSSLNIPFNFCLYGTNFTSLYINNNGNVSFNSPYSSFSSSPFPDPTYVMVAPFWADVDTRGTGTVQYKITPTAMYVNWVGVGYFSSQTDKINTFQLIITDGTDPILPSGNNIAFCYGDMQWTTGSASSGVNGFGGTPATVGINKGDGTNYVQMGRFDQAGLAYDGGYGANDGVDWLDNKSFYFNSCSSTNIAPIASGLNNCDTIRLCSIGDTVILNALFLSPEIGQTTTVTISLNGTPNASVLNITNGNSATAQVEIIGGIAGAGNHVITFTAVDNGTPAATTIVNANIFVDTTGLSNFNPHITGALKFCAGSTTTLSVSPTTYDSYFWSTGSVNTSISVNTPGPYWVTSTQHGCYKTNFVNVIEKPLPTPVITGTLFTCRTTPSVLKIDSASLYTSYHWSNSSTNDSISILSGTVSVTVTDSNGCIGTSPSVSVVNFNPTVTISGALQFCPNGSTVLTANPIPLMAANYLWSNAAVSSSTTVTASGTYYVTINYGNGCPASDTVAVSQFTAPVAAFTESPLNLSSPPVPVSFSDLSTIATGTITSWYWNFGDSLSSNSFVQNPPPHSYALDGIYIVTLAVQSSNGCWDTIRHPYTIKSELLIPNVFTPNGDGRNDLLVFKNLQYYPATSLNIFNRWGTKIYESSDYQNNWTGAGYSDGVYYFILQGAALKEAKTGFVEILR